MKFKQLMIGLSVIFCSFSLSVAANWQDAASEVESGVEKMLAKAAVYRGKVDGNLEPLYQDLADITDNKVDYQYISKVVMGKYYRRATDEQRVEFANVFKRTMLKTYGKTLVSFDVSEYELIKPRTKSPKEDKQKVVIHVSSDAGKTYSLDNYMVRKNGQWKLVNIVLDGFNLRVTFKNQFAKLVQDSKGNVGKAITKWADVMSKR